MAQSENLRLRAELDRIKKDLSRSEGDRLKQDAEALLRLQETEEDIGCLPTLNRQDIPPSVPIIRETAREDALQATLYNQAHFRYFLLCGGGRKRYPARRTFAAGTIFLLCGFPDGYHPSAIMPRWRSALMRIPGVSVCRLTLAPGLTGRGIVYRLSPLMANAYSEIGIKCLISSRSCCIILIFPI